jgi:hypothetical protein
MKKVSLIKNRFNQADLFHPINLENSELASRSG